MPTTIPQGFAQLQENLQITDLQETTVDTRQKNVRDAVAKELTVLTSFVTGSYRRGTLIAPLSRADIDIFVILDASYYSADGYANLIDCVKRVLKGTYPTTPEISRNGQAVTISFTDFKVRKADRDSLAISADLRGCRICPFKHSFNTVDQVGISVSRIVARIKDHKDVYIGPGQWRDEGASAIGTRHERCQNRQFFRNCVANIFLSCIDRGFLQIRDLQILLELCESLGYGCRHLRSSLVRPSTSYQLVIPSLRFASSASSCAP